MFGSTVVLLYHIMSYHATSHAIGLSGGAAGQWGEYKPLPRQLRLEKCANARCCVLVARRWRVHVTQAASTVYSMHKTSTRKVQKEVHDCSWDGLRENVLIRCWMHSLGDVEDVLSSFSKRRRVHFTGGARNCDTRRMKASCSCWLFSRQKNRMEDVTMYWYRDTLVSCAGMT